MKINLHTHTSWCDGKNTAEEMVIAAIEKGFDILGFSGHCMYPFSSSWHIPVNNIQGYCAEIARLKEVYKDKINIQLGFEADYIRGFTCPDKNGEYKDFQPDYLIGSVHYILNDDGNFTVDDKTDALRDNIKRFYTKNGDWSTVDSRRLVHDYFLAEREMLEKGNFDILGHADLIRIRNCVLHFFDEDDDFFKEEVTLTAKAAAHAGIIVEINTGAIARGNMDDVYPSRCFLEILHNLGVPVCINSDAHTTDCLDSAFERAADIARKAGYTELLYPVSGRTVPVKL